MSILLGIDTGGTFTDAVLINRSENNAPPENDFFSGEVIAKAKSLTVKSNLVQGIKGSVDRVFETAGITADQISLVSLSTTLATNALVEGHGGRAAIIVAGFSSTDIANSTLQTALGNDPIVFLDGAHDTHGRQSQPLNLDPLKEIIGELSKSVDGFAIAGYFAVRNPAHELAIREYIQETTNLPVTCSHELSDKLNGPKRALTTLLNARLIAMTSRLISATEEFLSDRNISCPLMVVRGDGSLVSAKFAMTRPIETILSGPAASLIGARWLTGADEAVISDIGGTTTDVAVLANGRPRLDRDGARVGEFQTMVEAVAMNTFGLGGDSEISLSDTGLDPEIKLGPGRVIPVSLLAMEHRSAVHDNLDRQMRSSIRVRHEGKFAMLSGIAAVSMPTGSSELQLLAELTSTPKPLDKLLASQSHYATLQKLVRSGHAVISAITPSDAMHVLGKYSDWDSKAAKKAVSLFARQKNGRGQPIALDAITMANRIFKKVVMQSAEVVLTTGFRADGLESDGLVRHSLVQNALNGKNGLVNLNISLDRPLIGLGASAHQYLPAAASKLNAKSIIPEHAEVANAIGAVVGQIELGFTVTIMQPSEGRFEISGGLQKSFNNYDQAVDHAEEQARNGVGKLAREAGAVEYVTTIEKSAKTAQVEGNNLFVEATITARVTARPSVGD